jgi:NADPH-dependent 2,4-dienoyl-CoA reductase/sulfur reductase-like enzyme
VLTETSAFAEQGDSCGGSETPRRTLFAERHGQLLEVDCGQLVLAVGAQEQFLPFPGWTLPNVFGVGGLQLLAKTGWPVQGRRVVVAGSGPLLLAVAAALRQRGARVTDLLEQAPSARVGQFALALPRLAPAKLLQGLMLQSKLLGVRYRPGCWPVAAQGSDAVQSVTLTDGRRRWERSCDYLACSFGLVPSLQWPRLLGCSIHHDRVVVDRWQQTSAPGVYSAGEATGVAGVEAALVEGQIAGYAASGGRQAREVRRWLGARDRSHRFAEALRSAFQLRDELLQLVNDDTVICRCEDVRWRELKDQQQMRAAKLHTRCGMGPCQGRVCHQALRILKQWPADTVRPPLLPATVGTLARIGADADDRE